MYSIYYSLQVHYFVDGFLQKNRASIGQHVIDCLKGMFNMFHLQKH